MKLANVKTHICNMFHLFKVKISQKISKMHKPGKIATAIGGISALITIFVFMTGKNLPDIFDFIAPPATTLEDSTSESKSDKNNDVNDGESNDVNIDVNIDGTIDINGEGNNGVNIVVNPPGVNTNEADAKSTEKLTMSPSAYRKGLECAISPDMCIIRDYYSDFNYDGNYEMFALVAIPEEKEGYVLGGDSLSFIRGQIWFVNQDGARNVSITDSGDTTDEEWIILDPFSIDEKLFLPCIRNWVTGGMAYLWGVTPSGEPYQSELSKSSYISLNDYNEIELTYSTYDFCYDADLDILVGHTWKPYYFYWDGIKFKEYGGKLISIDSLYSISGSKELLEQICTELKESYGDIQIKEIYYRENGVININYLCKQNNSDNDYSNYNVTLRCVDDELKIMPGEFGLLREGLYYPALIPFIASFPETSFESLFG